MIGLMDCNNFFVSCERLFRPDLERKPVAVLSSNDGCVVSRSKEVKELGIPMGIPYFEIKDTCKKYGITIFSSHFALYRDISARVMATLGKEFCDIEIYSVDEAFFTVPEHMNERELIEVRTRIMRQTGIPVSIGVGSTKTIAKEASEMAKRGQGVCVLTMEKWRDAIRTMPCESIWGIGRQTSGKLSTHGVQTVGELLALDHSFIRTTFGVVGERLLLELSGTSVFEVGEGNDVVKGSMTSSRSFKQASTERSVIESALTHHAVHLGEKLRASRLSASYITVIAAPSRYSDFSHRATRASDFLIIPTNETRVILKEVLRLFTVMYDPEMPYKKAGIVLGGLVETSMVTKSLFEDRCAIKGSLDTVLDSINKTFGHGVIMPASIRKADKWHPSTELKSPEYTTQWGEIPTVRAN